MGGVAVGVGISPREGKEGGKGMGGYIVACRKGQAGAALPGEPGGNVVGGG